MPSKDKTKNAEHFKKWYVNNREVQYKRIQDRKNRIAQEVRDYKESKPCMDCGVKYPHYVMDFDHRDPKEKEFNISAITRSGSLKRIWEEIAKCDLVCSNCHRHRTFKNKSQ